MRKLRIYLKSMFLGLLTVMTVSCTNNKNSATNTTVAQPNDEKLITQPQKVDMEVMENSVRIGKQVWMLQNLDVKTFRNGDPIFEAKTNPDWQKQGDQEKPVMGYYLNNPEKGRIQGNLYNWYAVNDPRGLCPQGWRVPTKDDWQELIYYLGGNEQAGFLLKNTEGWGGDGNGNNLSGFAGLPGGFRGYDGISYSSGYMARWWTSTEQSKYFAHGFDINYDQKSINPSTGYKQDGFSVRCIKE